MKSCTLFDSDGRHKDKIVVLHSSHYTNSHPALMWERNLSPVWYMLPFEFVIDQSPPCRAISKFLSLRYITKLKDNYGTTFRYAHSRP